VPYEAEFTPRPGLQQEIRVNLTSLEEARIAAIKPVITNPAGQRMKLFNPDRFRWARRAAKRVADRTKRSATSFSSPSVLSLAHRGNQLAVSPVRRRAQFGHEQRDDAQ
jgi:hypothetical protein